MNMPAKLQAARRRYDDARQHRDKTIREAAEKGMTRRAIAEHAGMTHGRVQQIIREEKDADGS